MGDEWNGNLSEPPQLVDVNGGDYRLTATSTAVDAGTSSRGALPRYDQVGATRVVDGNGDGAPIVDLGAFEFGAPIVCDP